jgi:preprotein translocase subunit SecF
MKNFTNIHALALLILIVFTHDANADIDFYGKINVSLENTDTNTEDETNLSS